MFEKPTLRYLIDNNRFILKGEGSLRFPVAPSLHQALGYLDLAPECEEVIIDLTLVRDLDSTVIGNLIHYFLNDKNRLRFSSKKPIIFCNIDVRKWITTLGVEHFFDIKNEVKGIETNLEKYTIIEESIPDKNVLNEFVQSSHQTLARCAKNPDEYNLVNKVIKK